MTNMAKCWAVIPAAGTGARMQSARPKQYLTLAGKTLLEYAIAPFVQTPAITAVMIALHPEDHYFADLAISASKIKTTRGGGTRAQSVFNALQALQELTTGGPHPDDFVLVHDAARPCLKQAQLMHLVDVGKHAEHGCILALPVQDTVKQVHAEHIQTTLDRTQLWRALTPQMFRFELLYQALQACLQQGVVITDEASAVEHMGLQPQVLAADSSNIKVTTMDDLHIAELYLQDMQKQGD